jgi:hypothetical protein
MRNFTAVVLVLTLCAGISLGQEADTSSAAEETQIVQETAPVITTTLEKITLPKWVIGFTANNLEFKSWPGTVTLQRRAGENNFLSLGISGYNQQYGPDENDNTYADTVISITKSHSRDWGITLAPEISRVIKNNSWLFIMGIEGLLSFDESRSRNETIYQQEPHNHHGVYLMRKNYNYGLNIPASFERILKIKDQRLSIGLRSYIFQVSSSVSITDRQYIDLSDNDYYMNWTHTKYTMPWHISYKNPFQGNMQLQIKYWF